MKKVLHIYNDYYPPIFGGIEKHINTICEGLKDKFQMQVLVSRGISSSSDVKVINCLELFRIQSTPILPAMPIWLKRLDSDILHFHLPCPTAMISYFLAMPKGRVIVTYHSDIIRQKWAIGIYKPLLIKFLRIADCIIATSPNYIESSPYLKHFKDKCIIIPHGIDINRFYCNIPSSPTVLFVGKLRYYKGLEYLIKSMEGIDAKLIIIGTGSEEKRLKKLAAGSEKIQFLGNIPEKELPKYYAGCSVFALPSTERSEAFGIVQLEAMASGKPVISTLLDTGVPWVNEDGITGIIVPPKDHLALRESINKLLKDDILRKQLGENARKRVECEFTKELMLNRIANTYHSP